MRDLPTGLLAINPRAFLSFAVDEPFTIPATVMQDGVAVLAVRGALSTYKDKYADSYESILDRVTCALEKSNRLVIEYDTPGGLCAGLFECAREIRRVVDERNATLVAYVRGSACSAGYALACVSHEVWAAPESTVGSLGVIDGLQDRTISDLMMGFRYSIVTSGDRKADGNPHIETSPEAIAAAQKHVEEMAAMFFAHVEKYRGVPADKIRALQAATFTGVAAQELTLVTRLGSLFECVTAARTMTTPTQEKEVPMKTIKEALAAVAAGDDPAEAEKAKAMLASMEEESKKAEGEEEKPAAEEPPTEESEEEEEEAPAAASAVSAKTLKAISAQLAALTKREELRDLNDKRTALLATRPDLAPETRKELESATLKEIAVVFKAIPKALSLPGESNPTAGSSLGAAGALDAGAQAAFDRALNKGSNVVSIKHEPTRSTFKRGGAA